MLVIVSAVLPTRRSSGGAIQFGRANYNSRLDKAGWKSISMLSTVKAGILGFYEMTPFRLH